MRSYDTVSVMGAVSPLRHIVFSLAAIIAMAMGGCGGGGGEHAQHAQGGQRDGGQRPAEPAIPVAVEDAHVGAIASYYTATATLAAEKEAQMLARVSGVVEALRCEEGDLVAAADCRAAAMANHGRPGRIGAAGGAGWPPRCRRRPHT